MSAGEAAGMSKRPPPCVGQGLHGQGDLLCSLTDPTGRSLRTAHSWGICVTVILGSCAQICAFPSLLVCSIPCLCLCGVWVFLMPLGYDPTQLCFVAQTVAALTTGTPSAACSVP